MLTSYIDTSALAKCYVREPRSLDLLDWVEARAGSCISSLSVVELRCLLARRRRNDDISADTERLALAQFDSHVQAGTWHVERMDDSFFAEARTLIDLLPHFPLRTLDALHLAAARKLVVKEFATADRTQADAAQALGFTVFTFFDRTEP